MIARAAFVSGYEDKYEGTKDFRKDGARLACGTQWQHARSRSSQQASRKSSIGPFHCSTVPVGPYSQPSLWAFAHPLHVLQLVSQSVSQSPVFPAHLPHASRWEIATALLYCTKERMCPDEG
jgi:hypothetical protein